MDLGEKKWRNSLFLRSGIEPTDLPEHCNGCGTAFDIYHALDCNNVCLITACHNDLCEGVSGHASKAFTPIHVCDNPKFYTGRAVCGGKDKLKGSPFQDVEDLKGYILIIDL